MPQDNTEMDSPNSARYLGPWRDYWWNEDYLDLISKRLNFSAFHRVLDLGCGVGHWGRALARFLPQEARIVGLDREEKWVGQAKENAQSKESFKNFEYQTGLAENLPFHDNSFDLITCQTLLIHVADVKKVIQEMRRVLKPGGLILLSEPNNLTQSLTLSSLEADLNVEKITQKVKFLLCCQKGKEKLYKGFNSMGDHLPKIVTQAGFEDLQIYTNDKTSPLIPPYESEEQQILVKQILEWCAEDSFVWPRDEAQEYFFAGGGNVEEFKVIWPEMLKYNQELANAIQNKTYWATHACTHYLISGRK